MSTQSPARNLVELETDYPVWDRFFTVAPLVLIGTRDEDGATDLAPKHMTTPMGWQNYFGFVCAPSHATCQNIHRSGEFTVSYPKPNQVLYSSLAASPRQESHEKPVLDYFATFPASIVDGDFIDDAYLYFECRHFKTVDGFGRGDRRRARRSEFPAIERDRRPGPDHDITAVRLSRARALQRN